MEGENGAARVVWVELGRLRSPLFRSPLFRSPLELLTASPLAWKNDDCLWCGTIGRVELD